MESRKQKMQCRTEMKGWWKEIPEQHLYSRQENHQSRLEPQDRETWESCPQEDRHTAITMMSFLIHLVMWKIVPLERERFSSR